MEASDNNSAVSFDNETEHYTGYFNESVVNKFINEGVLELVHSNDSETCLIMNNRDDFLSGFAAGVNEARLGRDQYYADYNANPFAFSVGYEHYQQYKKKKYHDSSYFCHGFECQVSGELMQQ